MINKDYIHFRNKWYDLANINTIVKHITRGVPTDTDTDTDTETDTDITDTNNVSNASYNIRE